ncbi:centromere protein X-like isoform X1 [Scleropages formosus]|uniref:Centromere protein X n=1 Tax=Scleropages formosus TaxID=113540 RepID=A0A8D0CJ85_SCLFO|nr:centromere protein X isoform X2 [Scleropages formosus]XP_029106502.1 centromere protein X-like isoform X1 [Scleropages formosus]
MEERTTEVVFKKETVGKLLSLFFKDEKTKVSGDAVILMAEMLKIFVEEAARRSQKQAAAEDCDVVDIEHFEKILPQLQKFTRNGSRRHTTDMTRNKLRQK